MYSSTGSHTQSYFFPDQARTNVQQQYTHVWSTFEDHMWDVFRHIENESKCGRLETTYRVTPQITKTATILPMLHLKRYITHQLQAIRYKVTDAGGADIHVSWDDGSINRMPPAPAPPQRARAPVPLQPPAPSAVPATMPPAARPHSIPSAGVRAMPSRVLRLN